MAGEAGAAAAPGPAEHQEQPGGGAALAVAAAAGPDTELVAEAMRQAAAATLLPFQRSLIEELLEQDGLVVLSPGLGLQQVVAVLLRLQDARLCQPGQSGVVLVLGASPWQRDALRRELRRIDPAIEARAAAAVGGGGRGAAGALGELCCCSDQSSAQQTGSTHPRTSPAGLPLTLSACQRSHCRRHSSCRFRGAC